LLRPKIHYPLCVSTFGETIGSLARSISQARTLGADLIELRLDFLKRIDTSDLKAISRFFKGNEILTIRSKEEGGKNLTLSENDRLELINSMITNIQPSFLDIEIETIRKCPGLMREIENSKTTKLIASFHDLEGKTNKTFLRNILLSAPIGSKSLFALKIVKHAQKTEDNLQILDFYLSMKNQIPPSKLVAFCTGRIGIASRILCLFFGSPYSYASLPGQPVAGGQLDIKTMRRIITGNFESNAAHK
jgi:3-dehydroquinate dehydratase type I